MEENDGSSSKSKNRNRNGQISVDSENNISEV
jgi:hypothetical protein